MRRTNKTRPTKRVKTQSTKPTKITGYTLRFSEGTFEKVKLASPHIAEILDVISAALLSSDDLEQFREKTKKVLGLYEHALANRYMSQYNFDKHKIYYLDPLVRSCQVVTAVAEPFTRDHPAVIEYRKFLDRALLQFDALMREVAFDPDSYSFL